MQTAAPASATPPLSSRLRAQVVIGLVLAAVGSAALAGAAGLLADYAYPIVWWGVLLIADVWNARRHGVSLWLFDPRRFFLLTVPLSVLIWLFFEALNLAAPQWAYHSHLRENWKLVLLGFASFSTVIPIVVEAHWITGSRLLPAWPCRWLASHKRFSWTLALVCTLLPLVNDVFWFNQGMWMVPALGLLPLLASHGDSASWAPALKGFSFLFLASLLAALGWEALNFPSRTGWHYLILRDVPHLFQMPWPGYIGFLPFTLSIVVLHHWHRRLVPSVLTALVLYAAGFTGLHALTVLYQQHGLWVYY